MGRGSCIPRQGGRSPLSLSSLYTFTFFTNSMREQHTKWTMVGGGGELHSSSRRKQFRLLWVDGKPWGGETMYHIGSGVVLRLGHWSSCCSKEKLVWLRDAYPMHLQFTLLSYPFRSIENCCDPIEREEKRHVAWAISHWVSAEWRESPAAGVFFQIVSQSFHYLSSILTIHNLNVSSMTIWWGCEPFKIFGSKCTQLAEIERSIGYLSPNFESLCHSLFCK